MTRIALLLLAGTALRADWIEFRSGPYHVLTEAGEERARTALNELEQFRHVLGNTIGRPELKTIWPVRIVVVKRGPVYPAPKLARDAYAASITEVTPEMRRALVAIYLDENAGRLPDRIERGLASLFSTFSAEGTRIRLGAPPAERDRDWSRMHMLVTDPRFSGKVRVLLTNIQNGVDEEVAWRNAFGMNVAEIERELDKYIEAGGFEGAAVSGKPMNPRRELRWYETTEENGALAEADVLLAHAPDKARAAYAALLNRNPKLTAAAEGLALASGDLPQTAESALLLVRIGGKENLAKAAKANPQWAEPLWLDAQAEPNLARRIHLLTNAAKLAPRRTEVWVALAKAQEEAGQFTEAVKSWGSAERSTGNEDERAKLRQARLAGEDLRRAKVLAEQEAKRRKEQEELEALRQKALGQIREAEIRANKGVAPTENVDLPEYREDMGYGAADGRLVRVECFSRSARIHIETAQGLVKLHVPDPSKVALTGGNKERTLGCGVQKPARTVHAVYMERKDAKLGTLGQVLEIDFRQ